MMYNVYRGNGSKYYSEGVKEVGEYKFVIGGDNFSRMEYVLRLKGCPFKEGFQSVGYIMS